MKPKNRETTVGLFLLGGIAIICTLIIFFGEMGDLFKPTYSLTVYFANASGLLKGSDVYLSGALIGKVTTDPEPVPDTQQVTVRLKINSTVRIRNDATFVIGSSGLLGDMYVEVRPYIYPEKTPEDKKKPYVEDGAEIIGATNPSLTDLAVGAQPLIQKANEIATQLDDMITRLNQDVLSGTSTTDLKETIAKLRDMVNNGDSMVKHADQFMQDADALIRQAKDGKGTLGLLLNDRQTRDNLRDLIENMKEHGPVFYRNDAVDQKKK
jgi:phospholipid/cholesterol/gamma-HCH transport system substrate-binding protein